MSFLPETNWVDIIVVIFLIRGGYIGFHRGFSIELLKCLGAIAATVVSLLYYERFGQWLSDHSFLSLPVANTTCFVILVILVLIVVKVVRVLLFKVLHLELMDSNLESWGGFSLGLLRSIVFASMLLLFLTIIPVDYLEQSVEQRSFFGPGLKQVAPKVFEFVTMFAPKKE